MLSVIGWAACTLPGAAAVPLGIRFCHLAAARRRATGHAPAARAGTAPAQHPVPKWDDVPRTVTGPGLRAAELDEAAFVLVVDDEQHIRYASPGLNALLGTNLGPLETLRDVVVPDDRGTITRALRACRHGDGVLLCALQRPGGGCLPVEATYRNLHADRPARGHLLTFRDMSGGSDEAPPPYPGPPLPAQLNRRSARQKFES